MTSTETNQLTITDLWVDGVGDERGDELSLCIEGECECGNDELFDHGWDVDYGWVECVECGATAAAEVTP